MEMQKMKGDMALWYKLQDGEEVNYAFGVIHTNKRILIADKITHEGKEWVTVGKDGELQVDKTGIAKELVDKLAKAFERQELLSQMTNTILENMFNLLPQVMFQVAAQIEEAKARGGSLVTADGTPIRIVKKQ